MGFLVRCWPNIFRGYSMDMKYISNTLLCVFLSFFLVLKTLVDKWIHVTTKVVKDIALCLYSNYQNSNFPTCDQNLSDGDTEVKRLRHIMFRA